MKKCLVAFFPNICVLQGLYSGSMKVISRIYSGLYIVDESSPLSNVFSTKLAIDNIIWHLRLGHPSDSILRHITPLKDHLFFADTSKCDVCFKAKQTHLPFPFSEIKTASCFELLHVDI